MTPSTPRTLSGVAIRRLADDLTADLLEPRRAYLQQKAPRDRSAHQLRRDLAAGKTKAFEHILRVTVGDLEDGVPLALALEPFRALIALVTVVSYGQQESPVPIVPLVQRAARAKGHLTEAQVGLAATPECVTAAKRVLDASARFGHVNTQLNDALRLRTAVQRVAGAHA